MLCSFGIGIPRIPPRSHPLSNSPADQSRREGLGATNINSSRTAFRGVKRISFEAELLSTSLGVAAASDKKIIIASNRWEFKRRVCSKEKNCIRRVERIQSEDYFLILWGSDCTFVHFDSCGHRNKPWPR